MSTLLCSALASIQSFCLRMVKSFSASWRKPVPLAQQGRDLGFGQIRLVRQGAGDDPADVIPPHDLAHDGGVGCVEGVVLVPHGAAALALQDADDLEGELADADGLADGVLAAREEVVLHGLADDADLGLAAHLLLVEVAAPLQIPGLDRAGSPG